MGGAFSLTLIFPKPTEPWKVGAMSYLLIALVSVVISIVLAVVEWRRAHGPFRWPLILLAVSALPLLWLLIFLLMDPD
jgi:hypothetical protein